MIFATELQLTAVYRPRRSWFSCLHTTVKKSEANWRSIASRLPLYSLAQCCNGEGGGHGPNHLNEDSDCNLKIKCEKVHFPLFYWMILIISCGEIFSSNYWNEFEHFKLTLRQLLKSCQGWLGEDPSDSCLETWMPFPVWFGSWNMDCRVIGPARLPYSRDKKRQWALCSSDVQSMK